MPRLTRICFILAPVLLAAAWALTGLGMAQDAVGSSVRFAQNCAAMQTIADTPPGAQRVSDPTGATYVIGYLQVSANNQDPILAKFGPDGVLVWCRQDYDTGTPDSRGYGLLWHEGALYGVFSVDGGGSGLDGLADGWLRFYSDASAGGGGPAVAVALKLDPTDGETIHGTFITARLSDNRINSLAVREICMVDDHLRVVADSWYSPRRADRSRMPNCAGNSPLDYVIDFTPDLSQAVAVSSLACGEAQPTLLTGCAAARPFHLYLPAVER
jgi:hypothetical protein